MSAWGQKAEELTLSTIGLLRPQKQTLFRPFYEYTP
jgi:hypothetical protein